jgi:hypothetical protein
VRQDEAIGAVVELVRRVNYAETALHLIREAWLDLDGAEKRSIGTSHPALAKAIVQVQVTTNPPRRNGMG